MYGQKQCFSQFFGFWHIFTLEKYCSMQLYKILQNDTLVAIQLLFYT